MIITPDDDDYMVIAKTEKWEIFPRTTVLWSWLLLAWIASLPLSVGLKAVCFPNSTLHSCLTSLHANTSDPLLDLQLELKAGRYDVGYCGGTCLRFQGKQQFSLVGASSVDSIVAFSGSSLVDATGEAFVLIVNLTLINYRSPTMPLISMSGWTSLWLSGSHFINISAPLGALVRFRFSVPFYSSVLFSNLPSLAPKVI